MSRARDFWLTHAVVLAAFLIGAWIIRRSASEPPPPESPAREPLVEPQRPSPISDRDRYLEVHRLASDFMRFEGTLVWDRFSGMVAFNGILIGFYALAWAEKFESPITGLLIPAVGLVIAGAWLWLTRVGMGYHDAWKEAMRDAERTLYGAHATSRILQDVGQKARKARWVLGDWGRAHKVQYYVIVGIMAVYVILLLRYGADDVWGRIVDFSAETSGSVVASITAVAAASAAFASWWSSKTARRALLAAQQPLLINVREGSLLAESEGPGIELGAENPGRGLPHMAEGRDATVFSLPFHNAGTGTAVITDATYFWRFGDDFIHVPEATVIGGLESRKYIPAGELARIAFRNPVHGTFRWWKVILTYSNLAGSETFRTEFEVSGQVPDGRLAVSKVTVTPYQ